MIDSHIYYHKNGSTEIVAGDVFRQKTGDSAIVFGLKNDDLGWFCVERSWESTKFKHFSHWDVINLLSNNVWISPKKSIKDEV